MKKLYPGLFLAVAVPVLIPFVTGMRGVPLESRSRLSLQPPVRYSILTAPNPVPLPEHALLLSVDQGETLESALEASGLETGARTHLLREIGHTLDLRRLGGGHFVRVHYDAMANVDALQMKIRGWGRIDALRSDGFSPILRPAPRREGDRVISAEIGGSFYNAMRAAGESPQLVGQVAKIFESEIDFFRLQKSDSFSLVIRRTYAGEDPVGPARIMAARFVQGGRTFEAFRYESPGEPAGYYMRDGTPLRAQFLRAPLDFTRITSRFSHGRFDPIFHKTIPHHGVDYGASTGTPVMATANGVVLKATRGSGEGNFVRIRHTGGIETVYMHLSRFASGMRPGKKVLQGEVIGFVGATGLATGPHLHYSVVVNGKWIDPLQLKSIRADRLYGRSLQQLRSVVAGFEPKLTAPPSVAQLTKKSPRAPLSLHDGLRVF